MIIQKIAIVLYNIVSDQNDFRRWDILSPTPSAPPQATAQPPEPTPQGVDVGGLLAAADTACALRGRRGATAADPVIGGWAESASPADISSRDRDIVAGVQVVQDGAGQTAEADKIKAEILQWNHQAG